MCHCWRFRCCRTWRTIHRRSTLALFPRQVIRTLFNVFFAMCHKVKGIEATKHFRPLLEDDASRKRKLPTSHSCPADLALSDPQLLLRRERRKRPCRRKPPAARKGPVTHLPQRNPSSSRKEDAVENGFELRKGIGLRFQRAQACRVQSAESHQQKAQFRREWASGP